MMDQSTTQESVYCGVVLLNAAMAGLNMLLLTWLSKDRRRADVHKQDQYANVMRRIDEMQDKLREHDLWERDSEGKETT